MQKIRTKLNIDSSKKKNQANNVLCDLKYI